MRTALSAPPKVGSWLLPAGAVNTNCDPLRETLPSPTGLKNFHKAVFNVVASKLSETGEPMVAESEAESLEVLDSPPPETRAVLTMVAGALLATLTVSVMGVYDAPAANASLRLQGPPGDGQLHSVPVIAVAVSPVGSESLTETVPLVDAEPLLVTVSVYLAPTCPRKKLPECDLVIVKSGT